MKKIISQIKKLRFQARINIAFSFLLFASLLGGYSLYRMNNLNNNMEKFYNHPLIVSGAVNQLKTSVININHLLDHYVIGETNEDVYRLGKIIIYNDSVALNSIKTIESQYLGNQSDVDSLKNVYQDFRNFNNHILLLKQKKDTQQAINLLNQFDEFKMNKVLSKTDVISNFAQNKAKELFGNVLKSESERIQYFWIIIAFFILLALFFSYYVSRSITKPIKKFVNELQPLYKSENVVELINLKKINEEEVLGKTANELKTAYQKLDDFKLELEKKVDQRTKELYKRKEDLVKLNKEFLRAKNTAEHSWNYLENVINNIGDPVFVTNEEGKLVLVNDAFCNMFKSSREHFIEKLEQANIDPEEIETFKRIDKLVLETGEENINEETFTIKDEEPKTILTRKTRYIDEEGNKFIIGVIRDFTERKKMELDLINAKERAEESERLKSAFLANMSHEIRTPMNAILGFSDLLNDSELDQEKRNEFIKLINEAGNRLLHIISDVMDVSKINSNQLIIQLDAYNINEIIDNLYLQFSIQIQSKEVHLETSKALDDSLCYIETDKNRVFQVLSNLIENALKFTRKGFVHFGYTIEDNMISFFVEDTGTGILEKDKEIIFQRFNQGSHEYTKASKGNGLGLAIAKGIVELLGGSIWIEKTSSAGTKFVFTIPYVKAGKEQFTNQL